MTNLAVAIALECTYCQQGGWAYATRHEWTVRRGLLSTLRWEQCMGYMSAEEFCRNQEEHDHDY